MRGVGCDILIPDHCLFIYSICRIIVDEINDSKGPENTICTKILNRKTFYNRHNM